jgi:O-acetyl-ADP-ribose deacetylase (regulator of RNase III)
MFPKIFFVDIDKKFIQAASKKFKDIKDVNFLCKDIRQIKLVPKTAVVSPANSLLVMTGGVDNPISKDVLPGIQEKVFKLFNNLDINFQTTRGRKYLPVGSAMVTDHDVKDEIYLISAPTMLIPQAVKKTKNAYYAFYATLKAAINYHSPIEYLVCPGFCTLTGEMDYDEVADQMFQAYMDVKANKETVKPLKVQNNLFLAQPNHAEQPRLPANVTFFT